MNRFVSHVAALVTCAIAVFHLPATAQGYRLRLDSRFQSVAFRGVQSDSILQTDVVVASNGSFETADGFAVRCVTGATFCSYFRPGAKQQGGPWMTTADLALWGLGVQGLSVRARTRLGVDLGDAVWPVTQPAVQLIEGYVDYQRAQMTAQLGRLHEVSRLGYSGFDGARVEYRPLDQRLRTAVYGGWGLARGVDLPVTSPALNPLDDFQPSGRHIMLGAVAGWTASRLRARVHYQREMDPRTSDFVSERAAFDGSFRLLPYVTATGGVDYDLAQGWWGSAEAQLTVTHPGRTIGATVGARRYRPHFELWTIWGAFSPVAYRAAFGSARVVPARGLEIRARGELYKFDDTEVTTPLVSVEDHGWRWSLDATYARFDDWTANASYHAELGPGAGSFGVDGGVTWRPTGKMRFAAELGVLERPLEFRFDDAKVWTYGVRGSYRSSDDLELSFGVRGYDEVRRRPDAAQFDWNQLRVTLGVTMFLDNGVDTRGLHPAILRIPERRTGR